jgi:hypothetical protein
MHGLLEMTAIVVFVATGTGLLLTGVVSAALAADRRAADRRAAGSNGDKVADLTGSGPGTTRTTRLEALRPIAEERGLLKWGKGVGFAEMVRGAAEAVGGAPDSAEANWRTLSGLTRGDVWASLATTDRDEGEVDEDGMVTVRTSSSTTSVANFTAITVNTTEHAVRLYDLRCIPA